MTDNLKPYMILYYEPDNDALVIDPWGYKVLAEDLDHAEEQFYNAMPDCDILWIVETDDYNDALNDYYGETE